LHPLTVEDILTEDTREKCELYPQYYFCCFRSFDADPMSDTFMEPIAVFNVVAASFTLTFHKQPCTHTFNVLERLQRQRYQLQDGGTDRETSVMAAGQMGDNEDNTAQEHSRFTPVAPAWVNYAILDDIADGFAPLLIQLQLEVDSVDELVLVLRQSEQTDMLRRLGETRRRVVTAARLLTGKPDVIRSLIKWSQGQVEEEGEGKQDEIDAYLSDILGKLILILIFNLLTFALDHLINMAQNVLHYERILGRAHTNYLAQINVELAKSSNRTNDAIAWLTIMGTMLLPMHVITGKSTDQPSIIY
jgi:magnesium transporter